MSVALCELTDVDRADVDGWLTRAELELAQIAVEPPSRIVDTSSAVLVRTSFKPGQAVAPVSLTLYRRHGRVRVDLRGAAEGDASSLESWLLDALELSLVARV